MRTFECKTEVITCSAAIGSCVEDRWQQTLAFADWARCSADVVVLNTAISTWCCSSWSSAVDALVSMTQQTFQPNVVSYGAAAACGSWGAAIWLLGASIRRDLGSSVACSAAISACEKRSFWNTAVTLLEAAGVVHLQRSIVCYNAASSACEKGMKWQATVALLAITAERLQPNIITYNAAISAGKQTNRWSQALHTFSELLSRFYPDTITCNSILAAFNMRWREAMQLVTFLQVQGVEANVVTFGSSIQTCAKAKHWQQALSLLVESQHLQIETDPVMYNALLRGCPWETAFRVLDEMKAAAIQPSMLAYDVLMQACSDQGQREDLWRLLVTTASERSALEYLWGLALLSCSESDIIHSACVEALGNVKHKLYNETASLGDSLATDENSVPPFSANELSCLWWSIAMLGVQNPQLDSLLTNQTARQIDSFELDELVTATVGVATSSLPLVAMFAQKRVAVIFKQLSIDSFLLPNLGMHVLGVVFSCQLASCLSGSFLRSVQHTLRKAGRRLDRRLGFLPDRTVQPGQLPQKAPVAPAIPMTLKNCAVLYKPPDWEVYGGHTPRQLLSFVKENLGFAPIFADASHFCGFLHRLDVPSSGLILVSTTYEAHYNLQVQLHAGEICRDYLVLSHGMIPWRTDRTVDACVFWHGDSPTFAGGRGRTAMTHVRTQRYAWDIAFRSFSQLEVRIATGRKHQIRSHLSHAGFPVVGDGTYASYSTYLLDQGITTRHWLHRHRVTFSADGKLREVQSDVPDDLAEGLRSLHFVPKKGEAAG